MGAYKPHNRKSIRLKDRDYAKPGAYFVTIHAYGYCAYFDDPEAKTIIETEWLNSASVRHNVTLDEFVVMPNHFHGILIVKARHQNTGTVYPGVGVRGVCNTPLHSRTTLHSPSQTLGAIIRGFKGAVTKKVNLWSHSLDMPVWQRNYYERIIRNEAELAAYRKYIRENPANWDEDKLNPINFLNGKPIGHW